MLPGVPLIFSSSTNSYSEVRVSHSGVFILLLSDTLQLADGTDAQEVFLLLPLRSNHGISTLCLRCTTDGFRLSLSHVPPLMTLTFKLCGPEPEWDNTWSITTSFSNKCFTKQSLSLLQKIHSFLLLHSSFLLLFFPHFLLFSCWPEPNW